MIINLEVRKYKISFDDSMGK